jgi:hypothetical protein
MLASLFLYHDCGVYFITCPGAGGLHLFLLEDISVEVR